MDSIRDDIAAVRASDWFARLTPVQQQLLGSTKDLGGDHAWGYDPATTTLHGWLKECGFLDRRILLHGWPGKRG